jgi:hypothetical protein
MFKKMTIVLTLVCVLVGGVAAQKQMKAWGEWSQKDAEKMLDSSAWAQTQASTKSSEEVFVGAKKDAFRNPTAAADNPTDPEVRTKYFVRFFSARPIRMALARSIMLSTPNIDAPTLERLKQFAELKAADSIIVTVWFTSNDKSASGKLMQAFLSGETSALQNEVYLERSSDGKRLPLHVYVKPGQDGFGARFIFLRTLDGQPFLTPESGEVRFHAELGSDKEYKIDRRFKVADMMYEGALEY